METGHTLGPYEILEQLGAGGMGEVWLAQDSRLGRKVAIKVLPEQWAGDPERLARFEQEARAAAGLNHPHIAAVFDIGVDGEGDDRVHYMVQEYLQGSTLREVIARGTAPLEQVLGLGTEIAEALQAAHRAGVVHRDLKPDNVFVTEDGHAKVLDFGLAKLTEVGGGAPGSESMSPTVLGTQAGAVMGTAGYMAPEQAQGEEVDHRADLFSFGCVLYEMATGKQPFAGRNVYDTLSRIVDQEPTPLVELDPALPAQLQWLVRKCLAKSPAHRYQGAGDLAVDLKSLAADVSAGRAVADEPLAPEVEAAGAGLRVVVPLVIAALLLGALGAWALLGAGESGAGPVRRFSIAVPEGRRLTFSTHPLAISPDGSTLVVLAIEGSERWLELRPLDQLEGREIPGTRRVQGYPFFSPDGRWLGFLSGGNLMKVSLEGEPPQTICRADGIGGATWTDAGQIVFSADGVLFRVSAAGGIPQPVPVPQGAEVGYYWPAALPGGDAILVAVRGGGSGSNSVAVVTLSNGQSTTLVSEGTAPAYSPTGHLTYGRDGFLFAAPFDVAGHAITGEAFPVLEGVHIAAALGQAHYTFANDGTLVYAPPLGGDGAGDGELVWVDLEGEVTSLQASAALLDAAALSPDSRRVAAQVGEGSAAAEIYVYELDQGGASQRLTVDGSNTEPLWSPDGEWVIFASDRGGDVDLYRKRADFSGDAELLLHREGMQFPTSIDTGGRIAFNDWSIGEGRRDIGILDPATGDAELVVDSEFTERDGAWSPDGRFLAFESNDTGRFEIYVLEPESGRRHVISNAGGVSATWSPAGDRIYYVYGGVVWQVDVATTDGFRASEPRPLFERNLRVGSEQLELQEVSADGDRFLAVRFGESTAGGDAGSRLIVTLNWFEEIRQRAAAAQAR